jgi:acetyl-CoA carboxylase carboxyltransferase component
MLEVAKMMTEKQIEDQSTALYATARVWDDGIIDPRDTRTVIAISLSAAYNASVEGTTSWGVFRH